jgi:hypothetical protein
MYMQISGNYGAFLGARRMKNNKLNGPGWSPMTAGFYENDGEYIRSIHKRLAR